MSQVQERINHSLRREFMSGAFKNITIFIESRQNDYTKPSKIGNLFLNRFTIGEEPSFELLGIYNLMDPGSSAKRIETKV